MDMDTELLDPELLDPEWYRDQLQKMVTADAARSVPLLPVVVKALRDQEDDPAVLDAYFRSMVAYSEAAHAVKEARRLAALLGEGERWRSRVEARLRKLAKDLECVVDDGCTRPREVTVEATVVVMYTTTVDAATRSEAADGVRRDCYLHMAENVFQRGSKWAVESVEVTVDE